MKMLSQKQDKTAEQYKHLLATRLTHETTRDQYRRFIEFERRNSSLNPVMSQECQQRGSNLTHVDRKETYKEQMMSVLRGKGQLPNHLNFISQLFQKKLVNTRRSWAW